AVCRPDRQPLEPESPTAPPDRAAPPLDPHALPRPKACSERDAFVCATARPFRRPSAREPGPRSSAGDRRARVLRWGKASRRPPTPTRREVGPSRDSLFLSPDEAADRWQLADSFRPTDPAPSARDTSGPDGRATTAEPEG